MFGRVKSLEAILATAQKKSLHRTPGEFQLTMRVFAVEAF